MSFSLRLCPRVQHRSMHSQVRRDVVGLGRVRVVGLRVGSIAHFLVLFSSTGCRHITVHHTNSHVVERNNRTYRLNEKLHALDPNISLTR